MAYPYYPGQYPYAYATPYLPPQFISPQVSPLIPPADLLGSPYGSPRRVHFEDDVRPPPPRRERRPSWYAGMPGMAPPPNPAPFPSPPMLYTALPAMVPIAPMTTLSPPAYPGHHRRGSDSNLAAPGWATGAAYPMYTSPWVYPSPRPSQQLHPLLNGEQRGGPPVAFDLSLHDFRVMHLSASGQPTGIGLSWPLKLEPHERDRGSFLTIPFVSRDDAPITLGDVLIALHRHLQQRITQVEWKRLNPSEEVAVSRAYTRRCRTYPSRVDYLLDKYMFKGLVSAGSSQDGYEKVKLVVGPAR
ncbi:uncharacterized protein B0H18DRAFT_1080910 [Fomitopsis serialis]|uniref:uncharacterized protein n=1 Tax=Fomitopsis serialis TaxID=139415 RepID=UPI0020086346|nr:uncharacterized protein B0H18DRAFT_1080910 [Neoantrodia serialis]KAH9938121.1 hypothetical protein B0H18DRAFT_1080910 [Neoantrodia serialis]